MIASPGRVPAARGSSAGHSDPPLPGTRIAICVGMISAAASAAAAARAGQLSPARKAPPSSATAGRQNST